MMLGNLPRRNRIPEPHDNDFLEVHVGAQGGFLGQDAKLTLAAVRHDLSSRYDASAAPPVSIRFRRGRRLRGRQPRRRGRGRGVVGVATGSPDPVAGRGAFLARTRQGRDWLDRFWPSNRRRPWRARRGATCWARRRCSGRRSVISALAGA
ncbi:hypothetical protein ACRAWD_27160 [Caulobacter segnis]